MQPDAAPVALFYITKRILLKMASWPAVNTGTRSVAPYIFDREKKIVSETTDRSISFMLGEGNTTPGFRDQTLLDRSPCSG